MIVVHGWYHWRPRRLAFRNDYCRACEADSISVLVRTLDVLHVFWIPLLPIGSWSRWYCLRCGARPHHVTRTRRGFKIAGAFILLLFVAVSWLVPVEPEADAATMWIMRLLLPVALFFTILSIIRHVPEPDLEQRLAAVPAFSARECPLCRGPVIVGDPTRCSSCGAKHLPLANCGS